MSFRIWCDQRFNPAAERRLIAGTAGHRLIVPEAATETGGMPSGISPPTGEVDIVFGQPPAEGCLRVPGLRWVHVSSAGYTRFDTPEFREAWRGRGAVFTTSSGVFADPCAQHVLAMMLALNRQLLPSFRDQCTDRGWHYEERRYAATLLTGQTVVLLGYGAIARRLAELLQPFRCKIYALRRQSRSEPGVHIVGTEDMTRVLPLADHLVNLMPDNEATRGWVNARRLACLRPSAHFYNVGRGTTVDQPALLDALQNGRLGAAFLDVTVPEPLPPEHPLWTAPHCHITPHIGGGRWDQDEAVVDHFLDNLAAFATGKPLADQVI